MNQDIAERGKVLTDWWIKDADPVMQIIDSIDIEWGGAAKWACSQIDLAHGSLHLDIACGWGSFMAHVCWQNPNASIVGLNIDFEGSHSSIRELLGRAGVKEQCSLVQSDARYLPFKNGDFDSVSCFLGLQDIEIGFGKDGLQATILNGLRVTKKGGKLFFIDREEVIQNALHYLGKGIKQHTGEIFKPDIRWDEAVGRKAVELYAQGYIEQMRIEDRSRRKEEYERVLTRMKGDMEKQLCEQGYFNPLEPLHLVGFERTR